MNILNLFSLKAENEYLFSKGTKVIEAQNKIYGDHQKLIEADLGYSVQFLFVT